MSRHSQRLGRSKVCSGTRRLGDPRLKSSILNFRRSLI